MSQIKFLSYTNFNQGSHATLGCYKSALKQNPKALSRWECNLSTFYSFNFIIIVVKILEFLR